MRRDALIDFPIPEEPPRAVPEGPGGERAVAREKDGLADLIDAIDDEEAATPQKRGRGRGRRPAVRRFIAAAALMPLASRAPLYARLMWSLVSDPRTPASRKAMLGVALGYVVLGRDIVPDRIPILGQLDDLVVVALATEIFLDGLDEDLLAEKLEEAGIPRAAYDEDVARVRRLVPGPIRRAARRLPGAFRLASDTIAQSGIQPRLRGWISGSPAGSPAGKWR
jgi:uncharacterized membrane protein YkvA (DUF1232 family)